MDSTTQSSSLGEIPPPLRQRMSSPQPSPLSYSFQLEDHSTQYHASDETIRNRSCLPGYPNQRYSTSNATNATRVQPPRSTSSSRSNHFSKSNSRYHRSSDALLTDEISMMDHLAITPSASMPIHGNMSYRNNHDVHTSNRDPKYISHASRGNGTPLRRPRNAASSISRSATAALATPRSSSSSTSQEGHSAHQHNSNHLHNQTSTGSQYNNQNGTATIASPSKRSSSRISFSSQLSSTTPSNHDTDDNGTVSTRRSEGSLNYRYNHNKIPSTSATAVGEAKLYRKGSTYSCSNHSIGSTTTKSSSGTNAMGNTEAISKRRSTRQTATSPHRGGDSIRDPKHTETKSAVVPSSPSSVESQHQRVGLDVDTMKQHVQETRRILDDLHRALGASNERRRMSLTDACHLFDHSAEQLHNIELVNGALTVVAKHLFLHMQLQLPHNSQSNGDVILHLILSATEMLSRSAPSTFMSAFCKIAHIHPTSCKGSTNDGGTFFVECLLRLLDRLESDTRSVNSSASNDDPILILNNECVHCIGRTLISLSRSSEFRSMFYQNHDLVKGLTQISSLIVVGKSNDVVTIRTNPECRLCRLYVLANLAKHSNSERRELLYHFGGFLDTLLRHGNFDPIISIRQAAAWCLLELTNVSSNCLAMAQNAKVLGTLVKMILIDETDAALSPSSTMSSTRESALTAMQNIAFDRLNRPHIINFKSGMVLEALKKTLTSDIDAKSRRRAAGTVVNLVSEDTAKFMVSYKGLSDTLALVATQDDNTDVQSRAALSLTKLAVHVADLQNHPKELSTNYMTVLDALVVTSLSKLHSTRITAAIRSLARNHPDHRPLLARHDGVVDTLTDVIQTSSVDGDNEIAKNQNDDSNISDRANAIHAMAHLVNSDDATRKHLCNRPTLLTAMVAATQALDSQDLAILVLERLATVPSNRVILSQCNGLIVAVAEAVERESRRESQRQNDATVPARDEVDVYSDDGKCFQSGPTCHLAKALLMSLLIAM